MAANETARGALAALDIGFPDPLSGGPMPAPPEPEPQPARGSGALRFQMQTPYTGAPDLPLEPPDVGNPAEMVANPGAGTAWGVAKGVGTRSMRDILRALVKGGYLAPTVGTGGLPVIGDFFKHRGAFTPEEQATVKEARRRENVTLPDFSKSRRLFEAGEEGKDFYTGVPRVLGQMVGDPDYQLALEFQAASAIGTEPKAQAAIGFEAYRRHKLGIPIDDTVFEAARNPATGKMWAIAPESRPNLLNQLRRVAAGGEAGGPKISPYKFAMGGDPDAYPVDRWMGRIHWPPEGLFTDTERAIATQRAREIAPKMRLKTNQFQAGQWAGIRGPGQDSRLTEILKQAGRNRADQLREVKGFQVIE